MTSNVDFQTKFNLFKNWHLDKIKISLKKIWMAVIFILYSSHFFLFFTMPLTPRGNLQVELISYEFKKILTR